MVTVLLLTGVTTEPIWYEVNRMTKPNAFRFGSYAVTITDSFTGPVLFTPKVKRMDPPNATVGLIGAAEPSAATNASPRPLATATTGCGTKATTRIRPRPTPISFRAGHGNTTDGGGNRGAACPRPARVTRVEGDAADNASPAKVTGIAIANPTSGPETPISKSARRFGIGSLMLINAPNVPRGGTEGRKNGRDACTLYRFATR